jgi:hypothetical protein
LKPPTRTPPSSPIPKPIQPTQSRPLPRPRVLPAGRLTKAERRGLEADEAKLRRRGLLTRPKVYPRDCPPPGTPCHWVCPHSLLYDIDPETEAITENFPDTDISTLTETCSLRSADKGGMTVEAVALALNRSTSYVEETVETALRKGGMAVGAKPRGAGGRGGI